MVPQCFCGAWWNRTHGQEELNEVHWTEFMVEAFLVGVSVPSVDLVKNPCLLDVRAIVSGPEHTVPPPFATSHLALGLQADQPKGVR